MHYVWNCSGTCSSSIEIDVEDGIVRSVAFNGGCPGNTAGMAALARGYPVEELVKRLKGIPCGGRGTSCPDQLAKALEAIVQKH